MEVKTNYTNEGFVVKNPDGEDEIIHIPYNLNNVLVNETDIIQILAQYNVKIDKINKIEYFRQSFTHKSYCKKDIYPQHILDASRKELGNSQELLDLFDKSYERLEYFGDRVLKVIVSMYLFHRYPKQDEGFMTRLQTKLEDKKNLAIMSKEIGLSKYFVISKQIESMNGRNLEKIHEDVFESFIGALFLSNGFEPCMFLIVNLLETLIDYSEKLYCDNNYKDQLLRVHHQNKWKFPQYITIHFEGPPHKRKYIMGVERNDVQPNDPIEKRCASFGIGSSKKEGEQNAAKMALAMYGVLKQDQYSQSDIYYPPWNKIANFDGETMIIKTNDSEDNKQEPNFKEFEQNQIQNNDESSDSEKIIIKPDYNKNETKLKESKVKIIEPKEQFIEDELPKKATKPNTKTITKTNTKINTKKPIKNNKDTEVNYDSDVSVHSEKSI